MPWRARTMKRPRASPPRGRCVSVVYRNAPDAFIDELTGRGVADVAETEHADHALVFIDHGQSPDSQRFHVLHGLGEVVVLSATMDAFRHHIARRCVLDVKV